MNRFLLALPLIATMTAGAQAAAIKFQSAPEQTALLELYTSEGCNSCPPAETWLSHLKESPGLWKDFVPLAFHVDYWDYLGWRDPWAVPGFSGRQRAYAESWHNESIYTPGFVLNGKEWRDWYERNDGLKPSKMEVGVLTVSSTDTNRWQVTFSPMNMSGTNYEVHAALLAGSLSSNVKTGENRGRRLKHDFVVSTLVEVALTHDTDVKRGEFALSAPPATQGGSFALAVWITQVGHMEPLQATGGWLVPSLEK